ncbi:hypothetical protein BANRA_05299 [Klebsiella pneumoniae]|nr:hypothetical protein BANRA_05366 [Klebsiella pneumoniae]VDA78473.1 hypothetical protein BANRA_05299 [Klebsiella pneumoniae]
MSNNIIDTVTQAVNSLVSALKLPDESAKANDTLGSMNFPQFSRILPYKDYDSATGLFINNKTVGFMFEARPLPGADKSIVATLEHLLRSKLPGASRSVFIWSPANWSAMISTMVCVNSAGVVNRLRSLTPLPRPTTSGQRRRSSPCLLIWICPSRCVTTACTSPAAYPGRRTPPRKLSRWRTR